MKTSELTGAALDWAVNHAERLTGILAPVNYCGKWEHGGPIIEREGISIIRIDDEDIPDAKGFWTGKKVPQWGAVIGERHGLEENHGSQGDYWGMSYHVDENAVCGPTPLIAAMRCYVASKMGDNIDIPEELK
jgi:hypothetical protein